MALVGPPEGVLLEQLVLLEVGAHAPALVVRQSVAVLGKQRVDARDAPVPAVLQILRTVTIHAAGQHLCDLQKNIPQVQFPKEAPCAEQPMGRLIGSSISCTTVVQSKTCSLQQVLTQTLQEFCSLLVRPLPNNKARSQVVSKAREHGEVVHLEGEAAVLGLGLLALERVLGPHALAVGKLGLPGHDVAVQVGDELVLLVAHARPEVGNAQVGLLAVAQVGLGDQDVAHG